MSAAESTAPDRYVFVPLTEGGLLLDLVSGGLLQLNRTAAFIWQRFLDGLDADAIASALAVRHAIDVARVRADVAATLTPDVPTTPMIPEDYQFRQTAKGYTQLYREQPEFELDATGAEVAVVMSTPYRRPKHLMNSLRAMVPKILSLRGHTVFHASAVVTQGRLLVFCGRSGVGKTTTAHALAERGATLVSEDKLLVRAENGGAVAWLGAEPYIESWVRQATISLLAEGSVSCSGLDEAARGQLLPIAEIGFLDVVPRHGDQLVSRRLGVQETATASFRGMFLGTALAAGWRRQLEAAVMFAERVPGFVVTMPDGLTALGRAAEALERRGTLVA